MTGNLTMVSWRSSAELLDGYFPETSLGASYLYLDALCAEAANKPQAISAAIASAPIETDRKTGKFRKKAPRRKPSTLRRALERD